MAPKLAALRRKIPALVEKPVTRSLEELRAVRDAAVEADTLVLPGACSAMRLAIARSVIRC